MTLVVRVRLVFLPRLANGNLNIVRTGNLRVRLMYFSNLHTRGLCGRIEIHSTDGSRLVFFDVVLVHDFSPPQGVSSDSSAAPVEAQSNAGPICPVGPQQWSALHQRSQTRLEGISNALNMPRTTYPKRTSSASGRLRARTYMNLRFGVSNSYKVQMWRHTRVLQSSCQLV